MGASLIASHPGREAKFPKFLRSKEARRTDASKIEALAITGAISIKLVNPSPGSCGKRACCQEKSGIFILMMQRRS